MLNPFNLKAGDFVINVDQKSINFTNIGKIVKLYPNNKTVHYISKDNKGCTDFIEQLEPFVRVAQPEVKFEPKFKKGDKIQSNDKCEYNHGTYTCFSDSFMMNSEVVSVKEIFPILNVEWFDKVPDFVPKFTKGQLVYNIKDGTVVKVGEDSYYNVFDKEEYFWSAPPELLIYSVKDFQLEKPKPAFVPKFHKDQIVTHYLYNTNKKSWFTVLVLEDSFINYRGNENFKGRVLKKSLNSNCSWKENDICEYFEARQFEIVEPFEPKFRKGDKFTISDNTFTEAFCDSYMIGEKEVVSAWNNNTYDVSKCQKITLS